MKWSKEGWRLVRGLLVLQAIFPAMEREGSSTALLPGELPSWPGVPGV